MAYMNSLLPYGNNSIESQQTGACMLRGVPRLISRRSREQLLDVAYSTVQ